MLPQNPHCQQQACQLERYYCIIFIQASLPWDILDNRLCNLRECWSGGRDWTIGVEGAHKIVQGTGHRLTGGNVARYEQHVSNIVRRLAGNFGNNGSTGNFLVYGIGCSVAIIGNLIPYIDNVSPFEPEFTVLRHPAVACSSGSRQEWVQNTGCFGTIAIRTVNGWNALQVDRYYCEEVVAGAGHPIITFLASEDAKGRGSCCCSYCGGAGWWCAERHLVVANNEGNASCEGENFKHGEHDDDGIELFHLQKKRGVWLEINK